MIYKDEFGKWVRENDEGEVIDLGVEEEWVICDECRGEGMSLCDGMRGHAYSMEEFQETFSEEERHGYFNGMYDTRCDSCGGSGKVKTLDFEKLAKDDPALSKEFDDYFDDLRYEQATYRAEMGWW